MGAVVAAEVGVKGAAKGAQVARENPKATLAIIGAIGIGAYVLIKAIGEKIPDVLDDIKDIVSELPKTIGEGIQATGEYIKEGGETILEGIEWTRDVEERQEEIKNVISNIQSGKLGDSEDHFTPAALADISTPEFQVRVEAYNTGELPRLNIDYSTLYDPDKPSPHPFSFSFA